LISPRLITSSQFTIDQDTHPDLQQFSQMVRFFITTTMTQTQINKTTSAGRVWKTLAAISAAAILAYGGYAVGSNQARVSSSSAASVDETNVVRHAMEDVPAVHSTETQEHRRLAEQQQHPEEADVTAEVTVRRLKKSKTMTAKSSSSSKGKGMSSKKSSAPTISPVPSLAPTCSLAPSTSTAPTSKKSKGKGGKGMSKSSSSGKGMSKSSKSGKGMGSKKSSAPTLVVSSNPTVAPDPLCDTI
jgi:hypothetical protein